MSAKQQTVMDAQMADMNEIGTFVTDSDITQRAILDNQAYYVFSPLEVISTDARFMGFKEVPKGRLFLIRTHKYKERSVSEEVMKGETETFLEDIPNPARDITESLYRSYDEIGLGVSRALLGAPPVLKDWCNSVLLDEAPDLLYQMIKYLRITAPTLIARAVLPPGLVSNFLSRFNFNEREMLEAVRKELLVACLKSEMYAKTYIGKYKGELLKSANPKDKGISYVHEKVRYYCEQLGIAAPDDVAESADRMREAALAAQQAGVQSDGLQRAQCPKCGNLIPLINGQLPEVCFKCNRDLSPVKLSPVENELAVDAVESVLHGEGNLHDVIEAEEEEAETTVGETAGQQTQPLAPSGKISEKTENVSIAPPKGATKPAAGAKGKPKGK